MMRWDREDTELVQRERLQGASAAEWEVTEEDREGRHAVHHCHPFFSVLRDHAAGLIVAGTIGIASEHLAASAAVALSPLLYATAIGIAVGNVIRIFDPQMNIYSPLASGLAFAKRRLLRAGIILYGAKLTFAKILDIGWAGLFIDLYVVSTTLFFGFALGRMLGLTESLTALISTGSAFCGCSAVAATQPIINGESHEVAAAVGVVVLCGTAAMFLYPFLFTAVPSLTADPRLMGIYTGSTVHELAGVVAAGNSMGGGVASTAVVTKLLRIFMLEPWIFALYYFGIGQDKDAVLVAGSGKAGKGVPWFAFGFLAVAAFNSLWGIPGWLQKVLMSLSAGFLSSAMAALGLETDLVKVRSLGSKPLVLGLALWVYLLGAGFVVSACLVRIFPA
mmetsp:Transcript_25743/g.37777  ORF Transcript_25743/g.37777 Transcript_25743/m.37777 type:complete len:392 (+) Transcript_25743:132-1307(+)